MSEAGEDALGRRARVGAAWTLGSALWIRLLRTAVFVVLARNLAPSDFGLVALASAFTGTLVLFVSSGFGQLIVQRATLDRELLDSTFWFSTVSGSALALGLSAASGPISEVVNQPQLGGVLIGLAPLFIISGASVVPRSLLLRSMNGREVAKSNTLGALVSCMIGLALAIKGAGVWSLVAQTLVEAIVSASIMQLAAAYKPGRLVRLGCLRQLVSFGSKVLGGDLLNIVSTRSDDFLIGTFLGSEALGYYSVAYKLLVQLQDTFNNLAWSIGFPLFARLQADLKKLQRAWFRVLRQILAPVGLAFLGTAALGQPLVSGLFGDRWLPSVLPMAILAIAGPALAIYEVNASFATAQGRPGGVLMVTGLSAALNLAGFLLFVRHGLVAVSLVFTARAYVVLPLSFRLIRGSFRWRVGSLLTFVAPGLLAAGLASLLGGVISMISPKPPSLQIVTGGVALLVCYFTLLYTIARGTLEDLCRFLPDKWQHRLSPRQARNV